MLKNISFYVSFFVFFVAPHRVALAAQVDKVAATVNNEVILKSDIDRFSKTLSLRKELDPLFGLNDSADVADPKKILEFLIQERLIVQNFKVTDAEVEQEIQGVQRNNNLDREKLLEFLKSKGFDFDSYFNLMKVGLSKRQLLDREIRSRVNISDDDIRNYYYNLSNSGATNKKIPMEYNIDLISVSNRSYRTPKLAEETAEKARKSILAGDLFADVARRVSDDPSAENGGSLGFMASDQLADPIKANLPKLQIGQVSDVIKTGSGYLILKVSDARSTDLQKLGNEKDVIREKLAREEYRRQLSIWAERVRNNAYVLIN